MVNTEGETVGKHEGYPFYTIGQRKGLGGGFQEPMYVVDINANENEIVVGTKNKLYHLEFLVENYNLISIEKIKDAFHCEIKIRYNDEPYNFSLFPILIEDKYTKTRDELFEIADERGIVLKKYYYPLCSNYKLYSDLQSSKKDNLPVANYIADRVLCLPLHGNLSDDDVNRIIDLFC